MNKKKILEFLLIFIIIFCSYYLSIDISYDDIWNYGFSYNIATGLIPYRDFNMVVTPLYPFLCSIFLKLIPSLLMFYIFNSLIITFLYFLVKKLKGNGAIIFLLFFLMFANFSYNMFLFFLIILLIYLEKEHPNSLLVGIIASLAILTKQSIAPFLILAVLLKRNFNDIKLRIIGMLIPVVLFLIYLLISNSLYDFINYCFLGLKEFGIKNFQITTIPFFILYVLFNIYFIYKLFKCKFKNNEILYILSYQIIAFPMYEYGHLSICLLMFLYYFIDKISINKITTIAIYIVLIIVITLRNTYQYNNITVNTKLNLFKYKPFNTLIDKNIYECVQEIKLSFPDEVFIFDESAYILKLELNYPINKFDLVNDGNMGSNGEDLYIKEIDEICQDKKCLFVVRKVSLSGQTSIKLINYAKNNYDLKNTVNVFEFYQNY